MLENPTMAYDSVTLFHADHGNLDTAALDDASLATAMANIGGRPILPY